MEDLPPTLSFISPECFSLLRLRTFPFIDVSLLAMLRLSARLQLPFVYFPYITPDFSPFPCFTPLFLVLLEILLLPSSLPPPPLPSSLLITTPSTPPLSRFYFICSSPPISHFHPHPNHFSPLCAKKSPQPSFTFVSPLLPWDAFFSVSFNWHRSLHPLLLITISLLLLLCLLFYW